MPSKNLQIKILGEDHIVVGAKNLPKRFEEQMPNRPFHLHPEKRDVETQWEAVIGKQRTGAGRSLIRNHAN